MTQTWLAVIRLVSTSLLSGVILLFLLMVLDKLHIGEKSLLEFLLRRDKMVLFLLLLLLVIIPVLFSLPEGQWLSTWILRIYARELLFSVLMALSFSLTWGMFNPEKNKKAIAKKQRQLTLLESLLLSGDMLAWVKLQDELQADGSLHRAILSRIDREIGNLRQTEGRFRRQPARWPLTNRGIRFLSMIVQSGEIKAIVDATDDLSIENVMELLLLALTRYVPRNELEFLLRSYFFSNLITWELASECFLGLCELQPEQYTYIEYETQFSALTKDHLSSEERSNVVSETIRIMPDLASSFNEELPTDMPLQEAKSSFYELQGIDYIGRLATELSSGF